MFKAVLVIALIVPFISQAQVDTTAKMIDNQAAMYIGGVDSLQKYIDDFKYYPASAKIDKAEGYVTTDIIIDTAGRIINIEISKGLQPGLDSEVIEMMRLMPDWTPATERGKPVFSQLSLNIEFNLSDTSKSKRTNPKTAEFIGSLSDFLARKMEYPVAAKDKHITGKGYAQFIIDEKGRVRWLKMLRSSGSQDLDNEILRVVALMDGHWKPFQYKNKPVKFYFILPIHFSLE